MIAVGIWWCCHCDEWHERNPDVPYVKIPERVEIWDSIEGRVKKALGKLQPRGYPVGLSDDLESIIGYLR